MPVVPRPRIFVTAIVSISSVAAANANNIPILEDVGAAIAKPYAHVSLPPMDEIDADHDLKVSLPEMSSWIVKRNDEAFREADKDHDGYLTADEYANWGLLEHVPLEFQDKVLDASAKTNKFWAAFFNSVAMILATEVGDKTFFIAAVLAMRHPQGLIFAGAISALIVMTVLSVTIGFALPSILPKQYTHYCATALFFYFGLKLIYEAYELIKAGGGLGPSEELCEVEDELAKKGLVESKHGGMDGMELIGMDVENGRDREEKRNSKTELNDKLLHILSQAFMLTFLAEWGDRSQIATIAMASDLDPIGVTIGGILGHSMCTGVACIGGRYLASRINERTVILVGGILFLCFGFHSLISGEA